MREGKNVRLTEEAHQLLVEKAEHLGNSMKEVASEAVISLFQRELKYNEYLERINRLETKVHNNKRFAFGAFVLGALTSGCVVYFSMVVL